VEKYFDDKFAAQVFVICKQNGR